MAESVHYYMESMIPELEYYLEREIFTREEIREIVRQRSRFEFKLRRRISKKQDFQRFIEYELQLESQRKSRQKFNTIEHKPIHQNLSMSIVRHIHSLYQRMLKKFHGDLSLWYQYIDFSRQSSKKVLGKVFARSIQYHPTCELLWIMSAKWEYHDRNRPMFARTIYQRALRILSHSSTLWIEYFKFELEFSINQCKSKVSNVTTESLSTSLYMGALPWAIFTHSIEVVHSDTLSLMQRFIEVYDIEMKKHSHSFPLLIESMLEKYQYILNSNSNNSIDSHFYIANRYIDGSIDNIIKAIQYISNAFTNNPSSIFMERIIVWLSSFDNDQEGKELVNDKIEQLLSYAEEKSLINERLYHIWIDQLGYRMTSKETNEILKRALESFPKYGPLLALATNVFCNNHSLLKQYLYQCKPKEHIINIVKNWLKEKENAFIEFFAILDILPYDEPQYIQQVILYSLEWALSHIPIHDIPTLYERFMMHKISSIIDGNSIVNICLCFAKYYKQYKKGDQIIFMRKVYERGLLSIPKSDLLWKAYISMETECGQHDRVGHLHWRREKVIQDALFN